MAKRKLPALMWGGFVDDRLHIENTVGDYGTYQRPAIFPTRNRAKLEYQDVRRLLVREVKVNRVGGRSDG